MGKSSIKDLAIGLFTASVIFIAVGSGMCDAEKPEIFVETGHSGAVLAVAFSPDGRYVLSGSADRTLKLWEIATGKEIRTFKGHSGYVTSVAFSPDGRYALSGSNDRTMKLWEIATGNEIRTFKGHSSGIGAVAFSPDGRFAISGGGLMDHTLKLWEIATGNEIRTFQGQSSGIGAVAFSPDGRFVISSPDGRIRIAGSQDRTLKLWEIATGKEIVHFGGSISGKSVAFSPDGRYALSGTWYAMQLWEIATGKETRTFKDSMLVLAVAFSPDGHYGLSGSMDKTMKLWEIAIGKEIKTFRGHSKEINSVAFSPDGCYALSGSDDKTLKLWEIATGNEIRTFYGHSDIAAENKSRNSTGYLKDVTPAKLKDNNKAISRKSSEFSHYTSAYDYKSADLDGILGRPRPEQSELHIVIDQKLKFHATLQSYADVCDTAYLKIIARMAAHGKEGDFDDYQISKCIAVKSSQGASINLHIQDQLAELLPKEVSLGDTITIYGTYLYMVKSGPGIIVDKFELSKKQ